jgi:hypothetical protein
VLACRPIDAEAQLAYAALGDLLAEVPERALAELPGPQRHALEVALLRAEPAEQRSLPRAVALGLLGVLRRLRAKRRRWSRSTTSSTWITRRRARSPSPLAA